MNSSNRESRRSFATTVAIPSHSSLYPWYCPPVGVTTLILLVCLVLAVVLGWVAFRVAFPKVSSGGVRALSLAVVLMLWSRSIRETSVPLYKFLHQVIVFLRSTMVVED